jgi:hypothetical protein
VLFQYPPNVDRYRRDLLVFTRPLPFPVRAIVPLLMLLALPLIKDDSGQGTVEKQVSWGDDPQVVLAAETALIGPENLSLRWPSAELKPGISIDFCNTSAPLQRNQMGGARAGLFAALVNEEHPRYLRNTILVYSDAQSADQAVTDVVGRWADCSEQAGTDALSLSRLSGRDLLTEYTSSVSSVIPKRSDRTEVVDVKIYRGDEDYVVYSATWVRVGPMVSMIEIAGTPGDWVDLAAYMTRVTDLKLRDALIFLPAASVPATKTAAQTGTVTSGKN